MWNLLNTYRITKTKRMVFIIVNAQGFPDPYIPKNRVTPSTLKVLERATAIQFKNYNVETMDLLRDKFPEWQKQIQDGRCRNTHAANCKDISFDLIEVNLQDIKEDEKKDLLFVPTSLELPPETVDKLEAAGANLLQRSKPYQKLLKDLKRGL
jgi:NTE family protein